MLLEETCVNVEVEKRTRFIYNPFLLNAAYQKIDYATRLRQLYVWRTHRYCDAANGMDNEERYRLIKENLYSEQVTADLFHLVEAMRREKFIIDIYHCNYEYVLFRLYCLLLAPSPLHIAEVTPYPPGLCDVTTEHGRERLAVELKCIEVLETWSNEGGEANRCIVLRALEHYVARHYFISLVNYDTEAVKRNSLFFNIKHRIEAEVQRKQRNDPDYAIEYNREVVISMLYVFLIDELHAQCKEEAGQLRTTYQTYRKPSSDDDYVRCERDMKRCERNIALLDELATRVWRHFTDEFFAFSFATITAFPADATPSTELMVMQRYTMLTPHSQKTKSRVKDVGGSDDFVIEERESSHIRYISLRKNRNAYEQVTRKMIFDHFLLQTHHQLHREDAVDTNTATHYTRCCQICNYGQRPDSLFDFYTASLTHTYYMCEYVTPSSTLLTHVTQEALLVRHLHRMIVDPVVPLVSLIYKNAMQAMLLFCDATHHKLNLFHVINLSHMIEYVTAQYPVYDHGPEVRQDMILRQASKQSRTRFTQIEQWQENLARDIDIYALMMLAVNVQSNEIEKYERSAQLERHGDGALNLTAPLFTIYQQYVNVLDDTMKKIY